MRSISDYVARVEKTCGEEKHFIVILRYDRKNEAIARILKRASIKKSISRMIFELAFGAVSFRLYETGKAIFRNIKSKEELQKVLASLLL